MDTTVFISPHLDDAVFSCAGMIQRRVAERHRVIIATIFSKGSNDYPVRRAEDLTAAGLLGAEIVHLRHFDAPDRSPPYRGFRDIIFGWHAEDQDTVRSVAESLKELCRREKVSALFAPLGVGTHVDHRIVHLAIRKLTDPCDMTFYEDRPYAYAAGAVELRLRELGFDGGAVDADELLAGFRGLPHVRQYLPPGAEREHCEKLLVQPLGLTATGQTISSAVHCSSEETLLAHQAAKCYLSQFESFCGTPDQLAQMDLHHSQRLGSASPRVERYWTFTPAMG